MFFPQPWPGDQPWGFVGLRVSRWQRGRRGPASRGFPHPGGALWLRRRRAAGAGGWGRPHGAWGWDHVGTMAGESKVLYTKIEHDEMRLVGKWYVAIFFLCGPIGCPSHSDWVSGWVAAEPLWVSEWLSSCSSHSGRVAEWLLRFLEPCCTSTRTISIIGVGKVKFKDGFARENEHI